MIKINKQAFTLIELLVVISIIGILASFSTVSLQGARGRARDAKRVSDIRQIQVALELYYNSYNEYPDNITGTIGYGDNIYMDSVPNAPTPADGDCDNTSNAFLYTPQDSNASYTISFCLGGDTGSLKAGTNNAIPNGVIKID
jgi:prepilin-type N-terminal cleavage/methylation domain-containing protein